MTATRMLSFFGFARASATARTSPDRFSAAAVVPLVQL
jgi:hypothetical protein